MTAFPIELPDDLRDEIDRRVAAGEFVSPESLIIEALRYYLERHRPADWEEYVRKEIDWSRGRAR